MLTRRMFTPSIFFNLKNLFSLIFLIFCIFNSINGQQHLNDIAPVEDPSEAASGVYSECVLGLSFQCLQRKALLFVDRLGRADKYPLAGGLLTLIRTGDQGPPVNEESLRGLQDSETLGRLVDEKVREFFDTHIIRLNLPSWLQDDPNSRSSDSNYYEIDIGAAIEQGRKKSGGKKGMRKMMMMMCMMMAGKFMMLGPLLLGLTKLIALKALAMGLISLMISKIMILKKLKMGGGGGGGGGHGGGGWSSGGGGGGGWSSGGSSGGGWDRAAHDIAYSSYIRDA